MQNIEIGNFSDKSKENRGWVVGQFIDADSPFCSNDFEFKWSKLNKGDEENRSKLNKIAKTLVILVYGKFQIDFPSNDQEKIILEKEGDYVFYDANVLHSWRTLEDSLVITLRWPSIQNDQIVVGV